MEITERTLKYDAIGNEKPGVKHDKEKQLPFLVLSEFALALQAIVEVGTYGAHKYSPRGMLSVPNPIERYEEAKHRHWLSRLTGEERDGESGLLHEAHEAWNTLLLLELRLREARRKGRRRRK